MAKEEIKSGLNTTREQMIQLLNEDLEGEHQAMIAYILHSQVLEGAAYTDIARELESQAREKLGHASVIAKHIDYSEGMPSETPKPLKTSNEPVEMLRAAFENERETVWRYRERVRQAEAVGESASSENLLATSAHEQHAIDLTLNLTTHDEMSSTSQLK
jgi:bacterioferritin